MSLESVVHRLIDVAAGTDRIGAHEAAGLHNEVDGVEPAPEPEPEPAPPTAEELAEFRAYRIAQANQQAITEVP